MRTPLEHLKIFWKNITSAWVPEVPDETRVTSARMSQTRLKALERPDYLPPEPTDPATTLELTASQTKLPALPDLTDVIGGIRPTARPSLAKVSHYRLAAYVASLPEEEQAKSREELEQYLPKK